MSDKTKFVEVECSYCHKKFNKTLHRHKEAQKNNWTPFCNRECHRKFQITSLKLKCGECSKDILVSQNRYKRSDSKTFFCGSNCFAKFYNKLHGAKSQEVKDNIRKGLKRHYDKNGYNPSRNVNCAICGKSFITRRPDKSCCSKQCGNVYQFGSLPYTKEEVINIIADIASKTNKTPQKRDCEHKLLHAAVRFFGTWNKAMKYCGLKPNHSKYQKVRLKCQDSHIVDSISERIIDEWFFTNNIKHEKNKRYPNSNMNCDFYLIDHNLWVEYFGLYGGNIQEYDHTIFLKEELAKKNNLNFIALKPDDLYGDKSKTYSEKLKGIFSKHILV